MLRAHDDFVQVALEQLGDHISVLGGSLRNLSIMIARIIPSRIALAINRWFSFRYRYVAPRKRVISHATIPFPLITNFIFGTPSITFFDNVINTQVLNFDMEINFLQA